MATLVLVAIKVVETDALVLMHQHWVRVSVCFPLIEVGCLNARCSRSLIQVVFGLEHVYLFDRKLILTADLGHKLRPILQVFVRCKGQTVLSVWTNVRYLFERTPVLLVTLIRQNIFTVSWTWTADWRMVSFRWMTVFVSFCTSFVSLLRQRLFEFGDLTHFKF